MTSYGFDDEPDMPTLPKKAKERPSASKLEDAIAVGNRLGFVARTPTEVFKTRRQLHSEPQSKLLLTGPSRIIEELRRISVEQNVPYWRVLEQLLTKDIT